MLRKFESNGDFLTFQQNRILDLTGSLFFSVFLGCILLVYISQTLAINGAQYAIILMGFILVITTRYFPDGIIFMLKKYLVNKLSFKNKL